MCSVISSCFSHYKCKLDRKRKTVVQRQRNGITVLIEQLNQQSQRMKEIRLVTSSLGKYTTTPDVPSRHSLGLSVPASLRSLIKNRKQNQCNLCLSHSNTVSDTNGPLSSPRAAITHTNQRVMYPKAHIERLKLPQISQTFPTNSIAPPLKVSTRESQIYLTHEESPMTHRCLENYRLLMIHRLPISVI